VRSHQQKANSDPGKFGIRVDVIPPERKFMKQAIREIFANELGIVDDQYSEHLAYNSIPEWDSTSHMMIILAMEEKFGVELTPDDVVSMTSIPKIYTALKSKGIPLDI
jgi:acyl carrier protein